MSFEDPEISEFNQYQKNDKASFLLMQIFSGKQKRLMDGKVIVKIHLQEKYANIF